MTRVVAATFSSRLEAEFAAEHLSQQGIDAAVSSDDAGGTLPNLQVVRGASVEVGPADLERAKEILLAYESEGAASPPLSTAKRLQSIVAIALFVAFVLFVVVYAALNMPSPG